jgi:DNA-directed RNA polymerase alpha subunit
MIFAHDFAKVESEPAAETAPETALEIPKEEVGGENEIQASALSTRAKNALVKNGITTLAKLQGLGSEDISNLSGLGDKTIKEILEFLNR